MVFCQGSPGFLSVCAGLPEAEGKKKRNPKREGNPGIKGIQGNGRMGRAFGTEVLATEDTQGSRTKAGAGECSLPYSLSSSSLRDGQVWPNPEVKTPDISSWILFCFIWGWGGGGLVNNGKERLSSKNIPPFHFYSQEFNFLFLAKQQ